VLEGEEPAGIETPSSASLPPPTRGIGGTGAILLGLLKTFKILCVLFMLGPFVIFGIATNEYLPWKGWALVAAGENIWIGFHEHAIEKLTEELVIPPDGVFEVALARHDNRCQLPCKMCRHRTSLILQAKAYYGL